MGSYGKWKKIVSVGDMIPDFVIDTKNSVLGKACDLAKMANNEIESKRNSLANVYNDMNNIIGKTKDAVDQVRLITEKIQSITDQIESSGIYVNTIKGDDRDNFITQMTSALGKLEEEHGVKSAQSLNAIVMLTSGVEGNDALTGLKGLIPGLSSHRLHFNIREYKDKIDEDTGEIIETRTKEHLEDVNGKKIYYDKNNKYTTSSTRIEIEINDDGEEIEKIVNNEEVMIDKYLCEDAVVILTHIPDSNGSVTMSEQQASTAKIEKSIVEKDGIRYYKYGTAILGVEPGNYDYKIMKDGYISQEGKVTVGNGDKSISDIVIEPGIDDPSKINEFTIRFIVSADGKSCENATVLFNGEEKITGKDGIAKFNVERLKRLNIKLNYSIYKERYEVEHGTLDIDSNKVEHIRLKRKSLDHILPEITDVKFIIIDEKTNSPISGASILFDGKKTLTDDMGEAIFSVIKPGMNLSEINLNYTIQKHGYEIINDLVIVNSIDENKEIAIKLQQDKENVNVKFTINNESNKPISNASILFDGEEKVTNSRGIVEFNIAKQLNQHEINLNYTIKREDYETAHGLVAISAIDKNKEININLQRNNENVKVKFTINNESNKSINNALILFNGEEKLTNSEGIAEFYITKKPYQQEVNFNYIVKSDGYELEYDIITISGKNKNKTIRLKSIAK